MLGNSLVAERLVISQEGISSMVLESLKTTSKLEFCCTEIN
jgi:hypothetical protein